MAASIAATKTAPGCHRRASCGTFNRGKADLLRRIFFLD
jgi:hypothetical protein